MELFERIKQVAGLVGSETKLAFRLNLPQTTFNGYLKASRQDNLWPLLPKILELFPQVRRDWLYFGEGEMTEASSLQIAAAPPCAVANPVQAAAAPMQVATQPLRAALTSTPEEEISELHALRKEVGILKDKLIAALEENTRLHERIHSLSCRGEDVQWGFQKSGTGKPATPATVVPGVQPDGN